MTDAIAKLEEAKSLVKLFGLDYDGTIRDGINYKQPQVFSLTEKILEKKKSVAFITARAATALKVLAPPLQELLKNEKISASGFIAGGNGTTLYEVKKDNLIEMYNRGFELPQILRAVEAGKKVYGDLEIKASDLAEKGLATFKKFLQEKWEGYVPSEIINICRPYNGELFTEQAKVTFVLPKNKSLHERIVAELKNELGGEYSVAAGDETYVHITRKQGEDGKIIAIKTILQHLNLELNQVVTFGDMPAGNDAGLLSFPYSFTNSDEFAKIKKDLGQPPYILADSNLAPIARVYKAIEYLLS